MQSDKTLYNQMLIYLITFPTMFKPLFGTRVFFEADGTGSAPAGETAPVAPVTAPANPSPPPPPPVAPKDPNAATRYQISRSKMEDKAARIQKEFDEYKAKQSAPVQKFTTEEDPTGEKEIKNIARQEALEAAKQLLKDS